MNLLMVLASENYRDSEFIVPHAFFTQAGHTVVTTASTEESIGTYGYIARHEVKLGGINPTDFDGVFFVGGAGSLTYEKNEPAQHIAKSIQNRGGVIGAICAAPRLLLMWGMANGYKITGHNWDEMLPSLCEKHGATYVADPVVIDRNMVTGAGPKQAEETALAFLQQVSAKAV